jgi:plasmid stability protein
MSKMIQIRNVPDSVHRTLKARAARDGMSLSDYLKKELGRITEKPDMTEWLAKVRRLKPVLGGQSSVEIIRKLRDGR